MPVSRITNYVLLLSPLFFAYAIADNTNLTACLLHVQDGNITLPQNSTLDSKGNPTNASLAVAIPYDVCVRECGPYASRFDWSVFSTSFSTWLLPWLALISQLPFGSQHRQQNAMSVLLTLGSPALAAYSLILCVLNWSWVPRTFDGINYPNVKSACRVLGSFQHLPLHIEQTSGFLASVVVLPENDQWWKAIDEGLNYEETWTTAIVIQIAWVVVAFVFTVVDSFVDGIADDFQSGGRGTGTLFLWLLPLVVGWQRLSPRCDYVRVREALWRANSEVYAVFQTSTDLTRSTSEVPLFPSPRPTSSLLHQPSHIRQPSGAQIPMVKRCDDGFSFTLKHGKGDQGASAPIYSYSRIFLWSENVELVVRAFRIAAHVATIRRLKPSDPVARRQTLAEVERLIRRHVRRVTLRTVLRRCILAGVLAMILHWGVIGSAIVYSIYTPTTGLGCRSGSFLVYASAGTLVWIAMITSSLLTHHAENLDRQGPAREVTPRSMSPKTIHLLANAIRRCAKFLAVLNAVFIVAACVALFSNLFTNCWCGASIPGRGYSSFVTISIHPGEDVSIHTVHVVWTCAITMSLGSVAIFIFFVYMHVNPSDPDPYLSYNPGIETYRDEEYTPSERHLTDETAGHDSGLDGVELSPLRSGGGHSPYPSSSS